MFLVLAIMELGLIAAVARWGREWLYGGFVMNLFLANTLGVKIVSVFGLETSSGNIFFAAAIFSLLLLIEIYGVAAARQSVWFGVVSMGMFVITAELVLAAPILPHNQAVAEAMNRIFDFVPQLVIASLAALVVSMNVAIEIYSRLRMRTGDRLLWFRVMAAVVVAQLVDSAIFFSIAFAGTVPLVTLWQIMFVGFAVKVLFGIASTPMIYYNRVVIKTAE